MITKSTTESPHNRDGELVGKSRRSLEAILDCLLPVTQANHVGKEDPLGASAMISRRVPHCILYDEYQGMTQHAVTPRHTYTRV